MTLQEWHLIQQMIGTVVKDSSASAAIAADVVGGALTLSSQATTDNDGCINTRQ